jgi:hypothetical protein
MMDKRETILAHLLAMLDGLDGLAEVDGVKSVFRNRGEIPQEKLPAVVLLDGREKIKVSTSTHGGLRTPTIFTLSPQIFIVLKPRDDINNDGIGEELSAYRVKIIKLMRDDDTLAALLGANGEALYLSSETDMQTGSTMQGQMQMDFAFSYVLNPSDL